MTDRPMSHESLTQKAYEELKSRIIRMELHSGVLMTESRIAEDLGMGRTPVREAIQKLKHEGFVKVIPRKGVMVSSLSADEVRSIYEMADGLEGMTARLAAERASQNEINELNSIVYEMKRALAANDMQAWVQSDDAFHAQILKISGNSHITEAMELIEGLVSRVRMIVVQVKGLPGKSTNEHEQIARMISERRGNDARDAIQRHHQRVREDIVATIQRLKWI